MRLDTRRGRRSFLTFTGLSDKMCQPCTGTMIPPPDSMSIAGWAAGINFWVDLEWVARCWGTIRTLRWLGIFRKAVLWYCLFHIGVLWKPFGWFDFLGLLRKLRHSPLFFVLNLTIDWGINGHRPDVQKVTKSTVKIFASPTTLRCGFVCSPY